MKNHRLLAIVFLFLAISGFAQTWTQMANYPGGGRYYSTGFTIGHYGFVGCGNNGSSSLKDFYKWNQRTNTWTRIADYPGIGVEYSPTGFSIGKYGYVCCGEEFGTFAQDLWRYDTTTNTWTQMASLPGPGRYDATVFVLGQKAYIITGSRGGPPYLNDVWEYDAVANKWTQKNNFPAGNIDAVVTFSIGKNAYAGAGWDGGSNHTQYWQYDQINDKWISIANSPMGVGAGDPRAFVVRNKAYVCLTTNNAGMAEVYDTISKSWCTFSEPTTFSNRNYSVALSIDNNGYVCVGGTGGLLNDLWQFGVPAIDFTVSDTIGCNGDTVHFTVAPSSLTGPFSWIFNGANPSVSGSSNPTVIYDSSGTYSVSLIIAGSGCSSTGIARNIQIKDTICGVIDSVPVPPKPIETHCDSVFNVPNVFTPNGDNWNDVFLINATTMSVYSIEIYDRWGIRVFKSSDAGDPWNGKLNNTGLLESDGVYYYIIKATCGANNYDRHGFVQVIR